MKKIQTVVAMKIKGRLLELTTFIDDIEDTKRINFEVDRNLYRKFEFIVGKGNVSETIRRFMKTVVRKYERLSDFDFFRGFKDGKKQKQEKG